MTQITFPDVDGWMFQHNGDFSQFTIVVEDGHENLLKVLAEKLSGRAYILDTKWSGGKGLVFRASLNGASTSRRYAVARGGDDEPGLILVSDNEEGVIVANSTELDLRFVVELVEKANAGVSAMSPDGIPMKDHVLAWLGIHRDHIPAEAVSALQDILGVPK